MAKQGIIKQSAVWSALIGSLFFLSVASAGYARCESLDYHLRGTNSSRIVAYMEKFGSVTAAMRRAVNATFSTIRRAQSLYESGRFDESADRTVRMMDAYVGYLRSNEAGKALAVFETIRACALADHVNPPTLALISNLFLPTRGVRRSAVWRNYLNGTSLDMPDDYYRKQWRISIFSLFSSPLYADGGDCIMGTSMVNWHAGPTAVQYNHMVNRFNASGRSEEKKEKKEKKWYRYLLYPIAKIQQMGPSEFERRKVGAIGGIRGICGEGGGISRGFGASLASLGIHKHLAEAYRGRGGVELTPLKLKVIGTKTPGEIRAPVFNVPGENQDTPVQGVRCSVILYEHANYQGKSEILTASDPSLVDNRIGNDSVTSIKIIGDCTVILYEHTRYGGRWERLTRSDPDLGNNRIGNDSLSSIKIIK